MRRQITGIMLGLVGVLWLSTPVFAAVVDFTGSLTLATSAPFTGTPIPDVGGLTTNLAADHAFSIGSSAFVLPLQSVPVGWTANAAGSSIYIINQTNEAISGAGSFGPGQAPGGGFGGTLPAGVVSKTFIGIVPAPNVYGTIVLPLDAGTPTTVVAKAAILSNAVTVTFIGTGWTTGTISDAETPMQTTPNAEPSAYSTMGTNMIGSSNGGGQITLVTPYEIIISGAAPDHQIGYAKLVLSFAPEPGTLLLIPAALAGLVLLGYRRRV